jgi:hypothetical protein
MIMIMILPIDLIVEIGILSGPDEYEEIAKTSERNAILLRNPYIVRATNTFIIKTSGPFNMCEDYYYKQKLHSFNDQPAVIWSTGQKEWRKHGIRHRDNGMPAIICPDGKKWFYQHGEPQGLCNDDDFFLWRQGGSVQGPRIQGKLD